MRDFNIDVFGAQQSVVEKTLHFYELVVNKATYLNGSLLDQFHTLQSFSQGFNITSDVVSVYFSDNDAVKIPLQ